MTEQVITALADMDLSQPEEHRSQRFPRRHLVELFERQALRLFKKHLEGKEDNSALEQAFIAAVKKSPSTDSLNCGIALAAEQVGSMLWKSCCPWIAPHTNTFRARCKHPLEDLIRSEFSEPSATGTAGYGWHAAPALVYAITSGNVEMVEIMAKYVNVNDIHDEYGRSVIDDIYVVEDEEVRRQLLDIIVPKLKVSNRNVCAAVATMTWRP